MASSVPLAAMFLQQEGGAAGIGVLLVTLLVVVFYVAASWRIFTKAGEPGWAAIVPIYNCIVLLKIAGKPVWWVVLLLIPFVNFIILLLVCLGLATNFNKGTGFAVGLLLLGFIFFPILAFGDAQYKAV